MFDRDWRYVYLNDAAARQGRSRREDLLGRTIFECYPGFETTRQFEVMRACMEDRTPRFLEDEFTYPDGSRAWFALGVHPAPEGLSVVSREITERKRNEARIAHLNAVLRGIRNVNQLITKEKDGARLLQAACDRLTETMGYRKTWIALRVDGHVRLSGHAGGDADALSRLAEAMDRGFVPDCARRALDGPGVVVVRRPPAECRDCLIVNAAAGYGVLVSRLEHEGVAHGVMAAGVPAEWVEDPEERDLFQELAGDIAFALYRIDLEKRHGEVEEQYRLAQRMESVGRLAGGVAHDFNNLMNIVLAYTGFVMDSMPGDDARRADLDEVRKAADRAVSLTRQLLAFSRKQVLQVEPVDLNEVVRGVEKMIRRLIGEDIEVRTVLDPTLGLVTADPGQIEQVIMNLVVNARDAMPEGGRLTIETSNVHLDEDYARRHVSARPGPHVMLAVSDTGCGMDEETRARIFEPFFTTKERGKGTGLGLATVYGIVKQSGGNIWVYSEPGKGSTFKIYFPRVEASGRPTPTRPLPAVTPATGSETILIVEDEEGLRRAYARALEATGFEVRQARDGVEAVQALREERFDVVVSDIAMPGMTGLDLLRFAREGDLDVPVVLVTGNPTLESAVQALEHGALRYLIKPVDAAELVGAVRRAATLGRIARAKREALRHLGATARLIGDRAGLEAALTRCLGRLWIAYQPIVDWRGQTVVAYEALVRCDDPALPDPQAIFSAAERLDRVHEVGRAIRARIAPTLDILPPGRDLFINLHPKDLTDDTLYAADSPLAPFASRIVLEVTERAELDERADLPARIKRLRSLGFRVAIDDLGAGYAGLSYFTRLVPEVVKIDVALVRDIHREDIKRKLVGSLTTLCRDLGMIVVAEGVETPMERDTVVELGCDLLQGYLFARPGRPFPDVAWA